MIRRGMCKASRHLAARKSKTSICSIVPSMFPVRTERTRTMFAFSTAFPTRAWVSASSMACIKTFARWTAAKNETQWSAGHRQFGLVAAEQSAHAGGRSLESGPADAVLGQFMDEMQEWRRVWTTSGVTDTLLLFKS